MKKVSIDQPCHESWNEMTSTERGAFCQKCSIDVYDFSSKSNEEVKNILEKNAGKHLCGRFKKTQLLELNRQFQQWENQSPQVFQSKFLLACLLVFGMTLFTGCIEDEEIMGDITPVEQHDQQNNNIAGESDQQDNPYTPHNNIKGKVAYQPEEETEEILGEIAYIPDEQNIKGNIVCPPEDTTEVDSTEERINIEKITVPEIDLIHLGREDTKDQFVLETEQDENTIEFEVLKNSILGKNIELKAYPNPANSTTTLSLLVPETGDFEIDLFDLSGALIDRIYSGRLPMGSVKFKVDLSPYQSGFFIINVKSNDFNGQIKVQKVR